MKVLLVSLFLSVSTYANDRSLVLKQGMNITCPKNHKPVYTVVKKVKEGDAVTSKHVVLYGSRKPPKAGDSYRCDSIVQTWRGVCIHTDQGWLPKSCQVGLRIKLEFEPVVR